MSSPSLGSLGRGVGPSALWAERSAETRPLLSAETSTAQRETEGPVASPNLISPGGFPLLVPG